MWKSWIDFLCENYAFFSWLVDLSRLIATYREGKIKIIFAGQKLVESINL